jgi:hypothetical protein
MLTMFLAEAAVLVVVAPLTGVFTAISVSASYGDLDGLSRVNGRVIAAGRLARALLVRTLVLTLASAALAFAMRSSLDAGAIWRAHAIVGAAALALMALAAACGAAFREPLDAAAAAVGLAAIVTVGVFAAGPSLDGLPRPLLEGALTVNPIVVTAGAADVDIFRMEPLYRLSPVAHRTIDYPDTVTAFVTYVSIAVVWTLLTRGPSRKRTLSVERTAP